MPNALLHSLVLVTGMSGAGKSSALKALEDQGYEAVDNLPLRLLENLAPEEGEKGRPLAVGVDCRTRDFDVSAVARVAGTFRERGDLDFKLVFLDCDDNVLRHRFTETRRRHPLAVDLPLADGVKLERRIMGPLRQMADLVFDTSRMSAHELTHMIRESLAPGRGGELMVFVTSFAYRNGLPREADLVFDVRFLDNPHYQPKLKPLTGRDAEVAAFIARDDDFPVFLDRLTGLLDVTLPRFCKEGKSYLTLGVGCTGGRHRSVYVAERLAAWLRDKGQRVELRHRELPE